MNYKIEKLKDVAQVITGKTPSTSNPLFYGGNISFISPADLNNSTIGKTKITLTEIGAKQVPLLPKNSVLVSCIGNLGKVGILDKSACFNQQINALVFDESKILPKYGFYFSLTLQKALEKAASKTVIPIVNKSKFSDLEISYPDLPTQTKIAQILDKADQIRQKRKKAIELADEFLRSLFLEMFGDPVVNSKQLPLVKLSNIGSLDRGKSKHRPRNDPILLGGVHPLIQTGDVANCNGYITHYSSTYSDIGLAQSKKWKKGTLCITIAANIAKTGILQFDACFPDSIVGFQPNKKLATTEYIRFWFTFLQKILEKNAPESAQKNINLSILKELELPLPNLDKQEKFSEICGKVYEIINKLDKHNNKLNELFNSLSQQYFTKAG
ncbi:restriction endonuclease subunit S [Mannheimia sp. HC-2023]|uniref:restriction endonuclease subunit S n=1 Tax=Mannheimia indoligenes TaxID=3103145 RepID=UPI002FE604A5